MKKVIILGAEGMLGHQVVQYFNDKKDIDLFFSTRNKQITSEKTVLFDVIENDINVLKDIKGVDCIINCIGVIKPLIYKNYINSIKINSIFPLQLADYCEENKIQLIHITTDCVFSGFKGLYDENDTHDCLDFYGKSKSLGEPKNCMVLRTSIIGREKKNYLSLISWLLKQKNNTINGFSNHYWNGLTTSCLSQILYRIVSQNLYLIGTYHIFSPNDVSKFELLILLNKKFNLNIKINKIEAEENINRTLRSLKKLSKQLATKDINSQINELV